MSLVHSIGIHDRDDPDIKDVAECSGIWSNAAKIFDKCPHGQGARNLEWVLPTPNEALTLVRSVTLANTWQPELLSQGSLFHNPDFNERFSC